MKTAPKKITLTRSARLTQKAPINNPAPTHDPLPTNVPGQGFRTRLSKAIGYMVIGLLIGFTVGILAKANPHQGTLNQEYTADKDHLALTGEYTAILENRERLDENGDIWVLDSRVVEVYR